MKLPFVSLCCVACVLAGCTTAPRPATPHPIVEVGRELWIDLVSGEEVDDASVIEDLAGAGVIHVGETHTIVPHHRLQLRLLQQLYVRGVPLVLCLEQLEARDQPAVERYSRSEIDFAALAREIAWPSKWSNYADYGMLCEFARQHRIPIQGLNAPVEVIRAVNRGGGVDRLTPEQRAQLPADLVIDDPGYERLMNLQLAVHAAMDPQHLRPMFEAQMARDETMAANIVAARRGGGELRTAFVVLGAGHVRYGFGTAAGVRRREPGIVERVVLATEGGHLRLSDADRAASREITITHGDLRTIGRPPGDYLRVIRPAAHPAPEPQRGAGAPGAASHP
jgi:uncharacterized iron-regulated protein